MIFSNSKTLKSALIFAALALAACDGRQQGKPLEEATFQVDSISIKETKVAKLDVFGQPEKKEFQFQACLIDAVARSGIVLTEFVVSDGQTDRKVKTEVNGCLLWTESHRVSSLQKERMLRIRRQFRGVEAFNGTVALELAFNPWGNELHDLRKFTPPYLDEQLQQLTFETDLQGLLKSNNSTMAEAYLQDVKLKFLGHDKAATKVTNQLTLKTAQRFRLVLNPQFLRRNLKNEIEKLDLKGGQFNISLVVLKNEAGANTTVDDLVAEYQGTVAVLHNGSATKDINLTIHDTAAVLSRNHVLITLEPVGDASLRARSGFFTGYIDPLKGNDGGIDLIPAEGSANDIARAVDKALADARRSAPSSHFLANYSGLKALSGGKEDSTKLIGLAKQNPNASVGQLNQLRSAKAAFCEQVYRKGETVEITTTESSMFGRKQKTSTRKVDALNACHASPDEYLAFAEHDLVETVLGNPQHVPPVQHLIKISIGRATELARSSGTETSASFKLNVGFGWSKAILKVFNVGLGGDWGRVRARSKSSGDKVSTGISHGQDLEVAVDGYKIDAEVRRCATVSTVYGPQKGFFSCEEKTQRRSFEETYYLVNHGVGNSVFTDENSSTSTNWRLTIRGDDMYKEFQQMVTQENAVLEFTKAVPFVGVNHDLPLLPDFKVSQRFPGAIPAN